ncbi:hypothetical protein BHM03_00019517 [Ensete ventricosum]|nr:hypothetical protein BHM03_00019517 [Ensete ventricosum]
MKSGLGPNAVATTGKHVIDLEVEVKRLRAEVEHMKAAPGDTEQRYQALGREAKKSRGEAEDYRSTRRQLDDEVLKLARDIEALRTKVQSTGTKVILKYKVFKGLELDMERIGRVTYEFGYQVTLECFQAKYMSLSVEEIRL